MNATPVYEVGTLIKRRRMSIDKNIRELSASSGVSASHLSRIEKGQRVPSARVLIKIAEPLGFEVEELFLLAGYLSDTRHSGYRSRLDPAVADYLAAEPIEIQRAVKGILVILKLLTQKTSVYDRLS